MSGQGFDPRIIPPSVLQVLQAAGLTDTVVAMVPYSNGLIAVIMGATKDDPNASVITLDLQQAMQNTGLTLDDLTKYVLLIDDALKGAATANPQIKPLAPQYRALYFTFFLLYLKSFAQSNKYCSPQCLAGLTQGIGPAFANAVDARTINRNMYGLSVKAPTGVATQISPWVFVYNDKGKTRLFLNQQDMVDYDEKFGGGILKKMFQRKNWPILGIAAASVAALSIGGGILASKVHKKRADKEAAELQELESEAASESGASTEV